MPSETIHGLASIWLWVARWIVVCAMLVSAESKAQDAGWTFLRGPNFDGQSTERHIVETWPENGPPVLWTRELGQGYSGFVAWHDRIATQCQSLAGQYVICLNAHTGRTVWQHRYDWPYDPAGVYPGPRATPTYADGRVYFAAPNHRVGCLDAQDGRLIWSLNLQDRFGSAGTDFGYSCSPTVVDGKVLLPVGGPGASLVALDAIDGQLVWKSGDDAASYTPAYPITFQGRRFVLGYLQNALVCHDLETGQRVWRRELSAGYDEHSAWPLYREPYLWLSSPFQAGSELLEWRDTTDAPLRTVWKSKLMSNDVASSVLYEGAIYGFDLSEAQAKTHRPSRGSFRCIDFLTGSELWSVGDPRARAELDATHRAAVPRVGHASLIVADGKLILLNDTGELILARATPERYEELGRVTVLGGEIGWTQPTLYQGRLFVRNHSRAVCVYLGHPDTLDPATRSAAVAAANIPQSRYVDWAALILGLEPEYAFDIPSQKWLVEWYVVSLAIMIVSAALACGVRWLARGQFSATAMRKLFWTTAFVLGALGTTVLSPWRGDFVFTWPICLFVAFQVAVYETRWRSTTETPRRSWWRSRWGMFTFLGVCVAYFLICRRLSLVFEWSFLCGFGFALPFVAVGAFWRRDSRWHPLWVSGWMGLGFTVFFWSAALVLWWKPDHH